MISRHLTPYLTPKWLQSRDLTNLTPITDLRARDARENDMNAHALPHVMRDPVIGVRLVRSKTYKGLGVRNLVRYGVRWHLASPPKKTGGQND